MVCVSGLRGLPLLERSFSVRQAIRLLREGAPERGLVLLDDFHRPRT